MQSPRCWRMCGCLMAVAVAAACHSETPAGGTAAGRTQPNIVFVLLDDMGFADLSVTGNTMVETANIDAVAAAGTLFNQFYVASPICSPSRVAFTTGNFPARHGINSYLASRAHNAERDMVDYLSPEAPSIARELKRAGYATAHFGKWHMGGGRDVGDAPLPQAYGFDESLVAFEGLGERLLPIEEDLSAMSEKLGNGPTRRVQWRDLTPAYVDRSIDFMSRNRERPFYLQVWLNDVHSPWAPSYEMVREQFESHPGGHQQRFNAMLQHADREIGRLIDAVDRLGLAEQTLILITSDNGPTVWHSYYTDEFGAPPGDAGPYRGRKGSLYEGGIRTPLIVRWPGTVPQGRVNGETVACAVDFYPTLRAIAGIGGPGDHTDGEDIGAAFYGEPYQRGKMLFWEYGRDADHYLLPRFARNLSPNVAVRDAQWKLLINADGTSAELYDMQNDPGETHDVSASNNEITGRLSAAALQWRNSLPTRAELVSQ